VPELVRDCIIENCYYESEKNCSYLYEVSKSIRNTTALMWKHLSDSLAYKELALDSLHSNGFVFSQALSLSLNEL